MICASFLFTFWSSTFGLLTFPSRPLLSFLYILPAYSYHRNLSQASLNFDDPTLKALLEALPEAPAMAQRKCLKACGLYKDDDSKRDSSDDKKRDSSDDKRDDGRKRDSSDDDRQLR